MELRRRYSSLIAFSMPATGDHLDRGDLVREYFIHSKFDRASPDSGTVSIADGIERSRKRIITGIAQIVS